MYTEEVPIYTNQIIKQRRYIPIYIYQSINYTEEVRQCIRKRYLHITISQLHRGGMTVYTEELHIYIPINQLDRGSKTVYREEVPIYTNDSNIQRKKDSVNRRDTYIYQSIN
jgi:hypothetical protein